MIYYIDLNQLVASVFIICKMHLLLLICLQYARIIDEKHKLRQVTSDKHTTNQSHTQTHALINAESTNTHTILVKLCKDSIRNGKKKSKSLASEIKSG